LPKLGARRKGGGEGKGTPPLLGREKGEVRLVSGARREAGKGEKEGGILLIFFSKLGKKEGGGKTTS